MDPQNIHNWNFKRPHTCHAQDEFAELLNDTSLQLEFLKQSLCHFWIRTRNECPVISDLAIHKLLDFCTTLLYSRESLSISFFFEFVQVGKIIFFPLGLTHLNLIASPNMIDLNIAFGWHDFLLMNCLSFAAGCVKSLVTSQRSSSVFMHWLTLGVLLRPFVQLCKLGKMLVTSHYWRMLKFVLV